MSKPEHGRPTPRRKPLIKGIKPDLTSSAHVEIPLGEGRFAIIDSEDWDRISAFTWCFSKTTGYAYAYLYLKTKSQLIHLHRLIMDAEPGSFIDHADRDPLNCRKSNLRFCSESQNCANRRSAPSPSGYRGVRIHVTASSVRYYARVNSRCHGSFSGPIRDDAREAALDFDRLATEVYGPFATLNFPLASSSGMAAAAHQPPVNAAVASIHRSAA